jgi:hypothetical protein
MTMNRATARLNHLDQLQTFINQLDSSTLASRNKYNRDPDDILLVRRAIFCL